MTMDLSTDDGIADMDALLPESYDPCDASWEEVLTRAVERGVIFLDAIDETWRDEIDDSTLDIASICRCVRGQLDFDRWGHAIDRWSGDATSTGYPTDLGMDSFGSRFDGDNEYLSIEDQQTRLTELWVLAIARCGPWFPAPGCDACDKPLTNPSPSRPDLCSMCWPR